MAPPRPLPLAFAAIPRSLVAGWRVFGRARGISLAVGGVFALLGTALLWGVQLLKLAPLTIPLLGGFLLVGPILMAGLLGVSQAVARGSPPSWRDGLQAWRTAPGLAAVALFCVLVFFIWLGDAGTLYSFLVGEGAAGVWPAGPGEIRFQLSAGVMGLGLAVIVFVVTVHAVPLLATGRASLVEAIVASVRAVFLSPVAHAGWALVLAAGIFGCLLVPPLLLVSLPVLAYGGHALHLEAFPPA
jgi:uncharacterized membrane protein